jgi:signal transduction histidine kinase
VPYKKAYTILVIEDNPGDYALVEQFLLEKIETAVIYHAINYKAATEVLANRPEPFDIVLLDLSLPDKTGAPLIQEIVSLSANVPIIVLTGYSDFAFGVQSLSLGISDYILKDELTPLMLHKSIVYSVERRKIISDLEASEKRVRSFANQLNNALEEERARIAREIHDEFGQQLSGLKMSLSSLKKFEGVNDKMENVINGLVADVNSSIETVRQIANELRPVLIDKLGLFAAIEWLVKGFEKKTGTVTRLYIDVDKPNMNIDKIVEINIFRICQEALTNITKHAGASLVIFQVENKKDKLSIKIIDNGGGVKSSALHNPMSMGLLNMKERASLINAEVNINSAQKTGTIVELIVNTHGKKNTNSRRSFSN